MAAHKTAMDPQRDRPRRNRRRRRPLGGAAAAAACAIKIVHLASAQEPNPAKNFCGRSWQDASDNCSERQSCPNASDEECITPGHFCFADTLCDSGQQGGGGGVPALPYDDRANTRFCQNQWDESSFECTLENWCGDGKHCPDGLMCFYSPDESCHLHDVLERLKEQEAIEAELAKRQHISLLDPEDPIRYHACGTSWGDANDRCSKWCYGEGEDDCPYGEQCFGSTLCYNDAGLVPSQSPTTGAPTTRRPTVRLDPINHRFCGQTWTTARCAVEDFCPTGNECKNGESCFTVQRCHIHDLTPMPTDIPTPSPTLPHDHPSYYRYCGKSSTHAASTCSVGTWCSSDDDCPAGSFCFGGLPQQCNYLLLRNGPTYMDAFAERPTGRPTIRTTRAPPTPTPTKRDDARNIRFCGTAWDAINCSVESHCPMGIECKSGELCFTQRGCNILDLTPMPTERPTPTAMLGPTPPPTAALPTTPSPTKRDDPRNIRFCGKSFDEVNCDIDSHCPTGLECQSGEFCISNWECNILDLREAVPTPTTGQIMSTDEDTAPPLDVPPHSRFCGESLRDAVENCGERTDCTLYDGCPVGTLCYDILHCPHFGEESAESEPSNPAPTPRPTVPLRTRRPTPPPTIGSYAAIVSTDRPTDAPVTSVPTKHPTPMPIPVRSRPSKEPTPVPTDRPITDSPTEHPTQLPTTSHPTRRPIGKTDPLAKPANDPAQPQTQTPEPTMKPTSPPTPRPSHNPTPDPTRPLSATSQPISSSNQSPSKASAHKPAGGGKGKESNEQSAAKDVATSEKGQLEEDENTVEEAATQESAVSTNNRPRLYCFSTFSNFGEHCVNALECGGGTPCPDRQFCMQVQCKKRPVPNGSLDLCPHKYVGQYTKDCKSFYQCDHGYVGPTYFCEAGFHFDLSSGNCIRQHLVNAECVQKDSMVESDSSPDEGSVVDDASSSGITYESFSDESNPTSRPTDTVPNVTSPPTSSSIHSSEPTPVATTSASINSIKPTDRPILPEEEFDLSQWYSTELNGANGHPSIWMFVQLILVILVFVATTGSGSGTSYTILMLILLCACIQSLVVAAQSANNNFCGTTWMDASDNCSERQHCPHGSDKECPAGFSCFADTLCDSSKGDGISSSGGSSGGLDLGPLAKYPYEDRANQRFCQTWDSSECKVEAWCGDDNTCPEGQLCHFATKCHLHDLLKEQMEGEEKEQQEALQKLLASLDPDDPIRYHSCGTSWSDANERCAAWCLESESECAPGEQCFGSTTNCYTDAGLVPTESPTAHPPSSRAPTVRSDPINFRYCGKSWAETECLISKACPRGDEDCTEDGEVCFTIQRCNIHDLTHYPTKRPTTSPTVPPDHPSQYRFCGKSSNHAASVCSLKTFCGLDDSCPLGSTCYSDMPEHCNHYYLEHPDQRPTPRPTAPTQSPTTPVPTTSLPTRRDDPRHVRFCGRAWGDVDCSLKSWCPVGNECAPDETCFTKSDCNVVDLQTSAPTTPEPTSPPPPSNMPTLPIPSQSPTPSPTVSPVTPPPTRRDDPKNNRFCGRTWGEVTCTLELWCPIGNECEDGWTCFTRAECNVVDFQPTPTSSPTTSAPSHSPTTAAPVTRAPSHSPTTAAPIPYDDPRNYRFCGSSWDEVSCARNNHCPTGLECTGGSVCYTVPTCNFLDLGASDALSPNHFSNLSFCGTSFRDALDNCSLETSCSSDASCEMGKFCFVHLPEHCNKTRKPTSQPSQYIRTQQPMQKTKGTPWPTLLPTDGTPTREPPTKQPAAEFIDISMGQPTSHPNTAAPTPKYLPPRLPKPKPKKTQGPTMPTTSRQPTLSPHSISTPTSTNDIPSLPLPTLSLHSETPSLKTYEKPGGNLKEPAHDATAVAKDPPGGKPAVEDVEGSGAYLNDRPRLYCFSSALGSFEEHCDRALECSIGNPCPLGQFCLQFDCKTRPQSNGSLDLCPYKYAGLHTKDCVSYWVCDHGYVGPTYTCQEGHKFDRNSGMCIAEQLVNAQCYRPESLTQSDSSGENYEADAAPDDGTTPLDASLTNTTDSPPSSSSTHKPALEDEFSWPAYPSLSTDDDESDLAKWYTFTNCSKLPRSMNWAIHILFIILATFTFIH